MVVGDDVPSAPRGDHGHLEELDELRQVIGAAGAQDAAPGEDHRPLGTGERVEDLADLVELGAGGLRSDAGDAGAVRERRIQDVLR